LYLEVELLVKMNVFQKSSSNSYVSDINDCTDDSCLNGGTCVDRIQGFECQCPSLFRGSRCELKPESKLSTNLFTF